MGPLIDLCSAAMLGPMKKLVYICNRIFGKYRPDSRGLVSGRVEGSVFNMNEYSCVNVNQGSGMPV